MLNVYTKSLIVSDAYIYMLNKNTWDVKSARPIRSNTANRQAQPKGLITAEAKKLLNQNIGMIHNIIDSQV